MARHPWALLAAMAVVFSHAAHGQALYSYDPWRATAELLGGANDDSLYTDCCIRGPDAFTLTLYRPGNVSLARWLSLDPSEGGETVSLVLVPANLAEDAPTAALELRYKAVTARLHTLQQEYMRIAAEAKGLLRQKGEPERNFKDLSTEEHREYLKSVAPICKKLRNLLGEERPLNEEQLDLFNRLESSGHTPAAF